ncbi:putative quinol monooxygenase [Pedobacter sp.]|uniref:putative quinol monooxygenase n=1 Tax=Pedobacter sp. TaxID=1411316 RepID=UPI003D7FFD77
MRKGILPYLTITLALIAISLNLRAQKRDVEVSKPAIKMHLNNDMLVRIAEIEVIPEYLEAYKEILKTGAETSVKLEPGVISIFPMFINEKPNQIRILEIYASKAAYESHLKTPHFLHYKTETLKMIKSLKLVDMTVLDKETMLEIFKKSQ